MKKAKIWLWLIFALALALRLYLLGSSSLSGDEADSIWNSSLSPAQLLKWLSSSDIHPPLFNYFLLFWIKILGFLHLPLNEAWLRLPFALFSAFQVLLLYYLGKETLGETTGKIAAFCLALSSAHIIMGQEIRVYPLIGLFALLSVLYLFLWLKYEKSVHFWAFIIFILISLYTHYVAILMLLVIEIYLLFYIKRVGIKNWLLTQFAILLGYMPWLIFLWQQTVEKKCRRVFPGDLRSFFDTFLTYFHGPCIYFKPWGLLYTLLLLLIVGAAVLTLRKKDSPYYPARLFGLMCVLPPAAMLAASFFSPYVYYTPRHIIFVLPFFILLWVKTPQKYLASLLLTLFVGLNLYCLGLWYYAPEYKRSHWREAAKVLEQNLKPDDAIVLQNCSYLNALKFYYRGNLPIYLFDKDTSQSDLIKLYPAHDRIWLVTCLGWITDPQLKVANWLNKNWKASGGCAFKNKLDLGADIVIVVFQKGNP